MDACGCFLFEDYLVDSTDAVSPFVVGSGLRAGSQRTERHITSNPADGCAALIATKRAANYPDITGMGPVFSERTQLRVCPSKQ